MKRLFSITLIMSIILNSCTSYKESYSDPDISCISPQIPKLYILYSDESLEKYNVLEKELNTNIFDNSITDYFGSIEMRLIKDRSKRNYAWLLTYLSIPLLPPLYSYTFAQEYDIIIYDIYDNIIANYTLRASEKCYRGLFYGDPDKLRIRVQKEIMQQLREFLHRDAVAISSALKSSKESCDEYEYQSFIKRNLNYRFNRKQQQDKMRVLDNERKIQQLNAVGNALQGVGSTLQGVGNQINSYNGIQSGNNIDGGRSRQQIMADINKWEGYKKDYERYLNEENAKSGSSYSPMRANMWNMKIVEVNNKLQELRNELTNAKY